MIRKSPDILFKRKHLLAFVMFYILGSTIISANENKLYLEEVIVTAQKREQKLIDVPISIVALGSKELKERMITNMEDLGLAVPGLAIQDSGPSQRRIFLRGIGNSSGSSSLIGLYLDEVSVTGVPYAQIDLRSYDLERVEVLRGPQGTLYGEGSVGGTIRFITKAPVLDRFSSRVDLSASFTKNGDPGQEITGVINVPVIEDVLGVRISGTYENAGGWIDQPAASRSDINDQDLKNIRIKALWQPLEALQVEAMAIIHRNDAGAANLGEDEEGNFVQTFDLLTTPAIDDDYNLYNLTLNYDFGSVRLVSSSSFLDTDKQSSQMGNRLPLFGPPPVPAFQLLSAGSLGANIFTEELRFNSTGSGPWQWTIGGFYRNAKVSNKISEGSFATVGTPLAMATTFTSVGSKESSESWAVFGNMSYALTDRLEVGAGLRYFEDKRQFFFNFFGVTRQEAKFDSTNPRVYGSYAIAEDIKVYASVAKGFRSGGFNSFGFPEFDSEAVWTYELGTKMSILDDRLSAEVALFYSDYSDYQVIGIPPPPAIPSNVTSNAGDATIKGIDWAFGWRATENLSLNFNGSYVYSEFDKINATSSSHAVGDKLDYIPSYQYGLSAIYDFDWLAKPGFVRLDYSQQGRSIFRNRSIFSTYKSSSNVINMLNLHIRWEWNNNLSLGLFARNLLDERGFMDPISIEELAARPRPRTLGFEVGLEFD